MRWTQKIKGCKPDMRWCLKHKFTEFKKHMSACVLDDDALYALAVRVPNGFRLAADGLVFASRFFDSLAELFIAQQNSGHIFCLLLTGIGRTAHNAAQKRDHVFFVR